MRRLAKHYEQYSGVVSPERYGSPNPITPQGTCSVCHVLGPVIPMVGDDASSRSICYYCIMRTRPAVSFMVLRGEDHKDFPREQPIGFELETIVRRWPAVVPASIMVKGDGSLRVSNTGLAVELPTAPASGTEAAAVIAEAGQFLALADAYTNASCGMHTHVQVNHMPDEHRRNIRAWWRIYEPVILQLVPAWRRSAAYCRPVCIRPEGTWRESRYSSLNIGSLHAHGTYEVRLPEGSTSPEFMYMWGSVLAKFFHNMRSEAPTAPALTELAALPDREIFKTMVKKLQLSPYVLKLVLEAIKTNCPSSTIFDGGTESLTNILTPWLHPTSSYGSSWSNVATPAYAAGPIGGSS